MTRIVEQWIQKVAWLSTEQKLPQWVEEGIHHGFEGVSYELPKAAFSLHQVHGVHLVEMKQGMDPSQHPEADGLWTRDRGVTIAVKTADCVPVLIHHPRLVMAIHAGWKGMAQDILGSALAILQQEEIPLQECRVAIGSCISLDSFEIGPEVIVQFRKGAYGMNEEDFAWASTKGAGDRWHLDLGMLAALRLQRAGWQADQITVIRSCTKKNPLIWHSFRRDGQRAGRNWSWIRL